MSLIRQIIAIACASGTGILLSWLVVTGLGLSGMVRGITLVLLALIFSTLCFVAGAAVVARRQKKS